MYRKRYLTDQIKRDLREKMVFLGGPRQVGKTTLAKKIITNPSSYLNWDIAEHRESILKHRLPNVDSFIFDEIHKYHNWRSFVKGLYDQYGTKKKILVTGSARLDYYRHGGDSLQGRYHYLRLFPFTVKELKIETQKDLDDLFLLGPFPEQFLRGSLQKSKRWSLQYRHRLITEEIRDLENVRSISLIELMITRLPDLVGSPLSINALREDLSVAFNTADNWLKILERLYYLFRVPPFLSTTVKTVKKEQKHYHFDYTQVKDEGARFENFIALHLYKWCCFQVDCFGNQYELRFYRDSQGREVDFVILYENKPIMFIEAKVAKEEVSKYLKYVKLKFPDVPAYQILKKQGVNYISKDGIIVQSALKFLSNYV